MKTWYPKDDEIKRIFDNLSRVLAVPTKPKNACTLGKIKYVQLLRKKDLIYIGWDNSKRKSIIYRKPELKIEKIGNGYKFFIR